MPYLFVICGAAGSGKSTLVKSVIDSYGDEIKLYKKFSERKYRGETDDIRPKSKIAIGEFDLAYEAMGKKYAISFEEINNTLNSGSSVILPTTDFRAVERLRHFFPEQCISLCVMSTIDSNQFEKIHRERYGFNPSKKQKSDFTEHFEKLVAASYLDRWTYIFEHSSNISQLVSMAIPEADSLEIRKTKILNFQTRLFEHPGIFDKIILNYRDGHPEDMLLQFNQIYKYSNHVKRKNIDGNAKLFVISAASGHGKGKLTEALRIIAPNEVEIVKKEGKRARKGKDKKDGLTAIGTDGSFNKDFSFHFWSHQANGFEGIPYAFDPDHVESQLNKGISQILVANSLLNLDLYNKLKEKFGSRVVHLFLWRFQEKTELENFQKENCSNLDEANARIDQTERIYSAYINNIINVDFLLLNTAFYEDMHNQVFNLIGYYKLYDM